MTPLAHKILTMASSAHMIVNEPEGTRLTIELVNWDDQTIRVVDSMDEYDLHVNDIDLKSDVFYTMTKLNPTHY